MKRRRFIRTGALAPLVMVACEPPPPPVAPEPPQPPKTPQPPQPPKPPEPVPYEVETKIDEGRSEYNHVVITEQGQLRRMYFVTASGKHLLQSTYDMARPEALDHEVFQTMISALLIQPKVKRMLMVGVGGAQVTNYLHRRIAGVHIDAVDICPEVVRLARAHFGVPDSPHYQFFVQDGRVFIEDEAHAPYDLLVLDAFRGHSIPAHLRSKQFFEACRRKLAPGGVMVVNMHRRTPRYPTDRTTLSAVFPICYRFTSPDDVQTSVVCSTASEAMTVEQLEANARELQPAFDIDLVALAGRVTTARDWEGGEVFVDDFEGGSMDEHARQQNLSCQPHCDRDQ